MANKVQLEAILKLVDVQINPQVFRKISQSVAGLPANLQAVSNNLKTASTNASSLNSKLRNTVSTLSQGEKAANLLLKRTAQFAILLPTFVTLNRAIQGSVKFLFEFDSALRDIVRVDVKGLSGRMEEIGDAAIKTAIDFGVLAQEVLQTTKVFVQAGLTIEDAQKRSQLAILATQVSTLQSADAIEFFLSASKQFNLSNEKLTESLDALVKVEDLAAVEAQDIAEAFRTGGNSLAEFGKDINDAIGLISSLREQTRKSGREIGTFFKTLQTRIFAAGESRDALEALGVQVENLDGSLRPTLDVLNDMKVAFEGLTEAQAANAGKAIGGVRQYESLIATLNSLERANELSKNASEAAGAADLKRTVTDEKLDRQLGKLIAQGQAFAESLGDAGLEDAIGGVLKVATALLKIFTSLSDAVADVGGNLTPFLALAGIQLGRSVFGLKGQGAPGGGAGAAQPGSPNFIGPLTQQQASMSTASKDLKRLGGIAVDSAKLVANFGYQAGVSARLNIQYGISANVVTTALKQQVNAIKANVVALGKSQAAAITQQKIVTNSTTGLLALTLASSYIPGIFKSLEEKSLALGGEFGQVSSDLVGITGAGASMATQFAALGGQAAGIAGLFGLIFEAGKRVVDSYNDQIKSFEEIKTILDSMGRTSAAGFRLQGGGRVGADASATFLDNLTKGLKNKNLGNELNAAISEAFSQTSSSNAFKDLGISAEELRNSFLGNIKVFSEFVKTQENVIKNTADNNGRLDQFNELMSGLNAGTLNTSEAFSLLVRALGAGEVDISEITGQIKRSLAFEEFKDVQKITNFADEIRTLNLELETAKLGPMALADDLVRLDTEFQMVQRSAEQTRIALRESLSSAIENLGKSFYSKGIGLPDLLNNLLDTSSIDQGSIDRFKQIISELPKAERAAAEEVLKIVQAQLQNELTLRKAQNSVIEEEQRRAKAMYDVQVQASQSAFEATRKFTTELMKFGDAVNTEVLQAFQSLSTQDVEDVLSGSSSLSDGLQQLILSAFGDDKVGNKLAKAQTNLNAVADETQAKLDILARRLEIVNTKIADSSNSNNIAALTAEQMAIKLDMETAVQDGAIAATEAKIKVLEAERDVAREAKEAEEKHHDMLEKLANASRQFNKDLRDSERAFQDFRKQKLSDLLKKEQEAREKLKEAQQAVLSSTEELASSYEGLIQAQLQFNNTIAEAKLKSNLLAKDIAILTGELFSFNDTLSFIGDAFNTVLRDSNITLEKRIDLERQLAEETLNFLKQARDEIVQAGVGIFGQSSTENQDLGKGIAGLQYVADTLGGSFESFLNLTQGELSAVTQTLLGLPVEFRQQILNALSFLPSSANIGGFSVEQLTQAIGQVGAGVSPEAGLPSIEELNNKQVEQLQKLQDLALQDAQLQYAQVINAQEQVAKADEQLQASKILEQRATESLGEVRDAVLEEAIFLDVANQERRELLNAVIAADDRNTLNSIENEAQLFADQNNVFREVGDNITRGIASAIGSRLATLEAARNVANLSGGFIPNFAGGNINPGEAAGLLRAASREKKSMPAGAGLAIANTSEAIIPMRSRGFVPNFNDGNIGPIAAGISAAKSINETVVAAISQSITQALSDLQNNTGSSDDLLAQVISELSTLNDTIDQINVSNSAIQTNTTGTTGATTGTQTNVGDIRVVLETNQNNTVTVSGLSNLRSEIETAVRSAASDQVDTQLASLLDQLDSIMTALQERGLLSSFSQPR